MALKKLKAKKKRTKNDNKEMKALNAYITTLGRRTPPTSPTTPKPRGDDDMATVELPAIALVEDDADVSFASTGERLFCMAGSTCIASLDVKGDTCRAARDDFLRSREVVATRSAGRREVRAGIRQSLDRQGRGRVSKQRNNDEREAAAESGKARTRQGVPAVHWHRFHGRQPWFLRRGQPAGGFHGGGAGGGRRARDRSGCVRVRRAGGIRRRLRLVSYPTRRARLARKSDDFRNEMATALARVNHRATARATENDDGSEVERASVRDRLMAGAKPSTRKPTEAAGDDGKPASVAALWAEKSNLGKVVPMARRSVG